MTKVQAAGAEVDGRRYKRVPAGYEVPPERAELLLHDALYAGFELPLPPETHTSEFPGFCAERWGAVEPLQRWLVRLVDRAQ